jgi:hypothetical protein
MLSREVLRLGFQHDHPPELLESRIAPARRKDLTQPHSHRQRSVPRFLTHPHLKTMKTNSTSIEPLEPRIAPAAVFTFTDVDGDKVTVTTSKGTSDQLDAIFNAAQIVSAGTLGGLQLKEIDFSTAPLDAATGKSIFYGTNLTVTATPQDLTPGNADKSKSGDGFVNIGFLDATNLDGDGIALDLGVVVIDGDLGEIDAGTGTALVPAVKSLTVQSMANFSDDTGVQDYRSKFNGTLTNLTVKSDFRAFGFEVMGGGTLLNATIHGSVVGGTLSSAGNIGTVTIGGDLEYGFVVASGRVKSVSVGGHVFQSEIAGTPLGSVKIGGDLIESDITSGSTLGTVFIGGSMDPGSGGRPTLVRALGKITSVTVGHDLKGGFSTSQIVTDPGSGTIGGSIFGGSGTASGSISSDGAIGVVKIGGSVFGGAGNGTGVIKSNGNITSITIGGSLAGGNSGNNPQPTGTGKIEAGGAISAVKIGGDLRTGGPDSGGIHAKSLGSVAIGGSMFGRGQTFPAAISATWDIGTITVKGSIFFGLITAVGQETPDDDSDFALKKLTVGGGVEETRIVLGYDRALVGKNADAQAGSITVAGDWVSSSITAGVNSGGTDVGDAGDTKLTGFDIRDGEVNSKIASIVIGGQVSGRRDTIALFGFGAEEIGAFKAKGLALALTAGPSTDTFALGRARPVGASLSTSNPDGFAVHVFEV